MFTAPLLVVALSRSHANLSNCRDGISRRISRPRPREDTREAAFPLRGMHAYIYTHARTQACTRSSRVRNTRASISSRILREKEEDRQKGREERERENAYAYRDASAELHIRAPLSTPESFRTPVFLRTQFTTTLPAPPPPPRGTIARASSPLSSPRAHRRPASSPRSLSPSFFLERGRNRRFYRPRTARAPVRSFSRKTFYSLFRAPCRSP